MKVLDYIKESIEPVAKYCNRHSNGIITGLTIGGGLVAIGGAVYGTVKTVKDVAEFKEAREELEDFAYETNENTTEEEIAQIDKDYKKTKRQLYFKLAGRLANNYGLTFAAALIMLLSAVKNSKIQAQKDETIKDITAAYIALSQSFKAYRKRVTDKYGREEDLELLYGTHKEKVTETDEDGKKTKKEVNVIDGIQCDEYTRFFDASCRGWEPSAEMNMLYLLNMQKQANRMLKSKGSLFLNEVYDLLGIERTKTGAIVGWIYDKNNPVGDNEVDFGIFDVKFHDDMVGDGLAQRRFVNGLEDVVLLNFNVDGPILDRV
jgi:hypothetical protein